MRGWLNATLNLQAMYDEQVANANQIRQYSEWGRMKIMSCTNIYTVDNLEMLIVTIAEHFTNVQKNILPMIRRTHENLIKVTPDLLHQIQNQEKLDVGEKDLERYFNTKKKMLIQFKLLLDSGESVKQKYREQVFSSSTRPIVKIHINITFGALFILAVLTIVDVFFTMSKYIGANIWSKGVTYMFFFTIFLTIINAFIIAAIAIWILGSVECPLNEDNFGFAFFVSENKLSSLCATPNTTFFTGLKPARLNKKETVAENLQIKNYTKIMVDLYAHPDRFAKIDTGGVSLGVINEVYFFCNTIGVVCECDSFCEFFLPKRQILLKHDDIGKVMKPNVDNYNAKAANSTAVVTQMVDAYYEQYLKYVVSHNYEIKGRMERADFECQPIHKEFSKIGNEICEELDIQLNHSWIYLFITMISCIFYLFIHILVYRRSKFEKTKEDVAVSPTVSPCSLSPISPQLKKDKEIQKNEGKVATTPTI